MSTFKIKLKPGSRLLTKQEVIDYKLHIVNGPYVVFGIDCDVIENYKRQLYFAGNIDECSSFVKQYGHLRKFEIVEIPK